MRSPARRRSIRPRLDEGHKSVFMGPIVLDGKTGFSVPTRMAVRQDGVWVDKRLWRGGWDFPRWYMVLVNLLSLIGIARHWY